MTKARNLHTLSFLLVALVPGILAVIPFFGNRFIPTHDGEYHIIRFYEFYRMLEEGYLFPRWAPGLNSGYGVPLFNFHYPFVNYVGVFLYLASSSFVTSLKLTLALGYILAITFCFFWLKKVFNTKASIIGSILASLVPYWFVDLYVRGSPGEVWAIAWVFAALAALEHKSSILFSLFLAFLILSHNILAMIFFPILGVYSILRQAFKPLCMIVGIGLATYFWLPALAERQYVVGLNVVYYRDHFPELFQLLIPSWGTGFSREGITHDEMSFQIGVIPLLLVVWGTLIAVYEKNKYLQKALLFFSLLFVGSFFLMLRLSLPIWERAAFLQLLQYPWRLLSFMIPITAFFGAYLGYRYVKSMVFPILLIIGTVIFVFSYMRPVTYEPRSDQYYLSKKEFTHGTSSIGNTFNTIWSGLKNGRTTKRIETIGREITIEEVEAKPLLYVLKITSKSEGVIRVNVAYFPGWTVYLDGNKKPIQINDGLISFDVAPGLSVAKVIFEETLVRKTADTISLISLFWLIGWAILNKYGYRYRHFPT